MLSGLLKIADDSGFHVSSLYKGIKHLRIRGRFRCYDQNWDVQIWATGLNNVEVRARRTTRQQA